MKKILLFVAVWIAAVNLSLAQCNPMDHDWQGAAFGVSPDPNLGETFVDGIVGQNYNDVVYVLAPENVADVDTLFEGLDITIDSISLDSITIFNGLADVQLSNIGLNVSCNNNGDSPNFPCHFMPGNAYCGDIFGVPTAAGEFQVKIFVTVFFNFLGPQSAPYAIENYTLNITDGEIAVLEANVSQNVLNQNTPNPASNKTQISYELTRSQEVTFEVRNLIGQVVYNQKGISKKGTNTIDLNTSDLESGIYIYSIQMADKKLSRRMVVQK